MINRKAHGSEREVLIKYGWIEKGEGNGIYRRAESL
jgi:hypothetical protein